MLKRVQMLKKKELTNIQDFVKRQKSISQIGTTQALNSHVKKHVIESTLEQPCEQKRNRVDLTFDRQEAVG